MWSADDKGFYRNGVFVGPFGLSKHQAGSYLTAPCGMRGVNIAERLIGRREIACVAASACKIANSYEASLDSLCEVSPAEFAGAGVNGILNYHLCAAKKELVAQGLEAKYTEAFDALLRTIAALQAGTVKVQKVI